MRFKIDDKTKLHFKAIELLGRAVPTRLTQGSVPYADRQAGGTGTCVFNNQSNGCNASEQLAQRRLDRRTIIGGIYERQINANTVLTIEGDYDVKDINQTFTTISDNINRISKVMLICGTTAGCSIMPLRSYVGFLREQHGAGSEHLSKSC